MAPSRNNSAGESTFVWGPHIRIDSLRSPFDSPVPPTHKAFADVKPVSWKRINVAGIVVTIYGVDELASHPREIACLWLAHGRGDTQDSMAYTASGLLGAWNSPRNQAAQQKGLICIGFDQRNHGSRMVDNINNVSWKQGNATHGLDMFNLYCGTAHDLSLLITQVPMYLPFKITEHLCGGVSLGGHASWVAIMSDPRIVGCIIVVGCPDYVRLMTDRAIRSKVPSTLTTDPPGSAFLGSRDFPQALVAAVKQYDPAGILFAELDVCEGNRDLVAVPSASEQQRIRPILQKSLENKKILCLSGGKDRLVPPACGQPFLQWLQRAIDKETGWAKDLNIELQDFTDPAAGHEFSTPMRETAQNWLCAHLAGKESRSSPESKF